MKIIIWLLMSAGGNGKKSINEIAYYTKKQIFIYAGFLAFALTFCVLNWKLAYYDLLSNNIQNQFLFFLLFIAPPFAVMVCSILLVIKFLPEERLETLYSQSKLKLPISIVYLINFALFLVFILLLFFLILAPMNSLV